jgi:hypothetical protein
VICLSPFSLVDGKNKKAKSGGEGRGRKSIAAYEDLRSAVSESKGAGYKLVISLKLQSAPVNKKGLIFCSYPCNRQLLQVPNKFQDTTSNNSAARYLFRYE